MRLGYGSQEYYADLGAEQNTIGAEKEGQKIAVEIKSFLNKSAARDLQNAIGQFTLYRDILEETMN